MWKYSRPNHFPLSYQETFSRSGANSFSFFQLQLSTPFFETKRHDFLLILCSAIVWRLPNSRLNVNNYSLITENHTLNLHIYRSRKKRLIPRTSMTSLRYTCIRESLCRNTRVWGTRLWGNVNTFYKCSFETLLSFSPDIDIRVDMLSKSILTVGQMYPLLSNF